ncbi:hypothetical protein [Vibrio diabolicus]
MNVLIVSEFPLVYTALKNVLYSLYKQPKVLTCTHKQAYKLHRQYQVKQIWQGVNPDIILIDTDSRLMKDSDIYEFCEKIGSGMVIQASRQIALMGNDREFVSALNLPWLEKPFTGNHIKSFMKTLTGSAIEIKPSYRF